MRLLYFQDDGSLAFMEFGRNAIPQYAILSHTWGNEEVTFQDLIHGTAYGLAGYRKITFCGEQAAKDGLRYFWIDTCCIDKRNLPELTKSINSMFRWYHNAARCYVYLSDLVVVGPQDATAPQDVWLDEFRKCRYWKRGWTLQELIAPGLVDFFTLDCRHLGSKLSLEHDIAQITGIPTSVLRGESLKHFGVEERFSWAANRETTEEEDIAYCLLGIFDVFMPLIYGEGEANALKRLDKVVKDSLGDDRLGDIENFAEHTDDSQPPNRGTGPTSSTDVDIAGRERRKTYLLQALGTNQMLIEKPRIFRRKLPIQLRPWQEAFHLSAELASSTNAGSIFQEAHSSFLNAVYWDEWPQFQTFDDHFDMMETLLHACTLSGNPARLTSACKHVDAFCSRWTHFFALAELTIEFDQEWSRTMWGALRLMFIVCVCLKNGQKLILTLKLP
jgi:hypothetical protein